MRARDMLRTTPYDRRGAGAVARRQQRRIPWYPRFETPIVGPALRDAFARLRPRHIVRNPVMLVLVLGCVLATAAVVRDVATGGGDVGFTLQLALWLWVTVLLANFVEAMAEGRVKARAEVLRSSRARTQAKRLDDPTDHASYELVPANTLRVGDVVICTLGDVVPSDGEAVEGVASVDESAINGESAPVIRESGGDRSAVTGGTKVLSNFLVVRVTVNPGETFADRVIAFVERASRGSSRRDGAR